MKVLWICNLPNRAASIYKGQEPSIYGGWLTGISNAISKSINIELIYCYPLVGQKKQDDFWVDNVHYYSFYVPKKMCIFNFDADIDNTLERKNIAKILDYENPDIIHIFGTEYIHSLMVAEICKNKNKIICSIQGLTSFIAMHYLAFVPPKIYHKLNFSSLFRKSLWGQMKELEKRGSREIETIRLCNNIIGRTEWDEACSYFINSSREYYKCNETLRDSFYNYQWHYEDCVPYSIFVSQGSSPLKGLNIIIEATNLLKKEFKNISLRIAGTNFIKKESVVDRLKISTYGEYIRALIRKYSLEDNITFLGNMDEESMVNEYLKCNVFVSASSIENSSNSVCEAMLLGVPVVSSNVGGIYSLINNGVEGLLYQGDAPYMAASSIRKVFCDKKYAIRLGENARNRALKTHDRDVNKKVLLEIYQTIYERNKNA